MTKIEIEKPVLPKWLIEKIGEATARVHNIYITPYVNMIFDELREVIDHRTGDIDLADKRQKYVMENERQILTALMFSYEVED